MASRVLRVLAPKGLDPSKGADLPWYSNIIRAFFVTSSTAKQDSWKRRSHSATSVKLMLLDHASSSRMAAPFSTAAGASKQEVGLTLTCELYMLDNNANIVSEL
jgi:hypothetical protein